MPLPLPHDNKPAQTLEEALARVLRAISEAEHPIVSVSLGRYADSVVEKQSGPKTPFYWGVTEQPVPIVHGTESDRRRQEGTDWRDISKKLIADLEHMAGKE